MRGNGVWIAWAVIGLLLFAGFWLLAMGVKWLDVLTRLLRRTREGMDEAAHRRLLENRRRLVTLQTEHSLWYRLEQELNYSGWKRKLPFLTAELWLTGSLVLVVAVFLVLLPFAGWGRALMAAVLTAGTEYLALCVCKALAMRSVNRNLLRFLDFLGNYSITAGEITSVFEQVSRYMDEPIRTVLEECSYEARTTGDTGLALLSMAEKLEHPKFKELARTMEISARYSADFKVLVQSSRRGVREYLSMGDTRREMVREAVINMGMLLMMSALALAIVDGLIAKSIWVLLFSTLPGRLALGCVCGILLLFAGKVYRLER